MTEQRQNGGPSPVSGEGPAAAAEPATGSDVVVLGRPTPDGEGLSVLRIREGRAELGALQPLRHGKPIRGELVTLQPRPELPIVCDVKVELALGPVAQEASRHGPAQVATDRYRENWDAIWAGKRDDDPPS